MAEKQQVTQTETDVNNGQVVNESLQKRTTEVKSTTDSKATAQNIVYYLLGVIEVLLGLRFVLKLLGANPGSGFVDFIYGLTGIFIAPFEAIFSTATTEGAETTSVFEPATLMAMAIYTLIAYGIVKLLTVNETR